MDAHAFDCSHAQRITNIKKQLTASFVVYADFESILQRVGDEAMVTTQGVAASGDALSASGPFQGHLPCSFVYTVVSSVVPDFSRPLVSYRGEDAGMIFVRNLQEEAEQLFQEYIAIPQQLLDLTDAELRSFHTVTNCHQLLRGDKVRDVALWGCIGVLHIVDVT